MDFYFIELNYNSIAIDNVAILPSIETLPSYEARAALTSKRWTYSIRQPAARHSGKTCLEICNFSHNL